MGTNGAPVMTDLRLYCYERDFMDSMTINMVFTRLLIRLPGTSMNITTLILKVWSIKFIHLNYS